MRACFAHTLALIGCCQLFCCPRQFEYRLLNLIVSRWNCSYGPTNRQLQGHSGDLPEANGKYSAVAAGDSIKRGCQFGFQLTQSYLWNNITKLTVYATKHVDNQNAHCHGLESAVPLDTLDTRASRAPRLTRCPPLRR